MTIDGGEGEVGGVSSLLLVHLQHTALATPQEALAGSHEVQPESSNWFLEKQTVVIIAHSKSTAPRNTINKIVYIIKGHCSEQLLKEQLNGLKSSPL